MADTFLKNVANAKLAGELANLPMESCGGDRVCRQDVIEDKDHAVRIPQRHPELAEGFDRERPGNVMGHRVVDRCDHDLTGVNAAAQPRREDLFGEGSHQAGTLPRSKSSSSSVLSGLASARRLTSAVIVRIS